MQQSVTEFMSCEYVPTSATLGKKKGRLAAGCCATAGRPRGFTVLYILTTV